MRQPVEGFPLGKSLGEPRGDVCAWEDNDPRGSTCIHSGTSPGIPRPGGTRSLHLPRHKVRAQGYFIPFRLSRSHCFFPPRHDPV